MLIDLFVEIITQLARVWVIYPRVGLKRLDYLTRILVPVSAVILIAGAISLVFKHLLENNVSYNILMLVFSEIITIAVIILIGLNSKERLMIKSKFHSVIKKIRTR